MGCRLILLLTQMIALQLNSVLNLFGGEHMIISPGTGSHRSSGGMNVQVCCSNQSRDSGCRHGDGVGRGDVGTISGTGLQSEGMSPAFVVKEWRCLYKVVGRQGKSFEADCVGGR